MAIIFENFRAFDIHHLNMLLVIGVAIFFGTFGARLFQRLHIPQIVGYIVIGVLLGPILGVMSQQTIKTFEPFNLFALGIIGFLIGGELKKDIFVKYGRQVFYVLLFEGITAFLTAATLCTAALLLVFDWHIAVAAGVVFGAICSATDPASTVSVLWEYKTRGPLTTMLTTIVALDDALAMILYIASVSVASVLMGQHAEGGFAVMAVHAVYEIAGSLVLGVLIGLLLKWIIRQIDDKEKILVFSISCIILDIGLAMTFKFDVILSSMAFGATLINILPRRSSASFEMIHKFSAPIYVLFFVIIGARVNVSAVSWIVLLTAAAYIIGCVAGKALGSHWGATYSKAAPAVRKFLGFCLYQQGTIAIALLIMASTRFEGQIRELMITVIIIGVFLFQIIGPIFVKIGVKKAGEVGMNVTEEDLIMLYKVKDVMESKPATIKEGLPLDDIINIFSTTDGLYYPVIDEQSKLKGIISISSIKETFAHQNVTGWLLACDIAQPVLDKTTEDAPLAEALERIQKYDLDFLPVVSDENGKLAGVLDAKTVNRKISAEIIRKREQADQVAAVSI
ncbi:MAG: cation:proton antiporter [Planctomycetes bacterium]|nr:cation:proton antiporter [Planctomycetota bacterium]MBU2596887.1 cation:proton antiporter [Planctomycetota bacterium]